MTGTGDQVAADAVRDRRRSGRTAVVAALLTFAVPVVMLLNVMGAWTLYGPEETPAHVRTYELLLVATPVLVVVAVVGAVRSGVRWPAFVALTMVPIVLVAAYVLAVPQGRWADIPSLSNDTPACWSGTDSCADSGG